MDTMRIAELANNIFYIERDIGELESAAKSKTPIRDAPISKGAFRKHWKALVADSLSERRADKKAAEAELAKLAKGD
jgi:hypothetical protein